MKNEIKKFRSLTWYLGMTYRDQGSDLIQRYSVRNWLGNYFSNLGFCLIKWFYLIYAFNRRVKKDKLHNIRRGEISQIKMFKFFDLCEFDMSFHKNFIVFFFDHLR